MPTKRRMTTTGRDAGFHLLRGDPPLVFVIRGSRLYEIDRELYDALACGDTARTEEFVAAVDATVPCRRDVGNLEGPTALSLNVAQTCNMACEYCYADTGLFGGRARLMSREVAFAAIDHLVTHAPGKTVTVGFIGGEPFLNRELLHESVAYAVRRATGAGIKVRFSVTTNGSVLTADDLDLLREQAFAVTVSLDGGPRVHDRYRPLQNGKGSFARILAALGPLLAAPGEAKLTARATIGRDNLDVVGRVQALAALGFHEVGVSPVRTGPNPALVFRENDWAPFLKEMIAAAEMEWRDVCAGAGPRFANLWSAVTQIHRGSARPLPCGSAVSYVSVSAAGGFYTCHRTIDDARFGLGSVEDGLDVGARDAFVRTRLVERQEPCASCWARYLCGGGCHAEVIASGRMGCDFIRGWLEHCIRTYDDVSRRRPELLS
jgi:uncharacterized protein